MLSFFFFVPHPCLVPVSPFFRRAAQPVVRKTKKHIPSTKQGMDILLSCVYLNGQGFINFCGNRLNWILGMEIISGISEMIVY